MQIFSNLLIKAIPAALAINCFVNCTVAVGNNYHKMGQRSDITDVLKLKITKGSYADETIIRFNDDATYDFDSSYDAWKMFSSNSSVPALFTRMANGYELAINAIPALLSDNIIDVYAKVNAAGTSTITASELYPFAASTRILLRDMETNIIYDLKKDSVIAINFSAADNGSAPRFRAYFSLPPQLTINDISCYEKNDGSMIITKAGCDSFSYSLYDSAGIFLVNRANVNISDTITGIAAGSFSIVSEDYDGSTDTFYFIVSRPEKIEATFITDSVYYLTDRTAAVTFINNSVNAAGFEWSFGDGNTSSEAAPVYSYKTAGSYTVALTASNGGCSSTTQKELHVEEPVISSIKDREKHLAVQIIKLHDGYVLKTAAGENTRLTVFDFHGRILFAVQNSESFFIHENYLVSGLNIWIVENENERWSGKLMK